LGQVKVLKPRQKGRAPRPKKRQTPSNTQSEKEGGEKTEGPQVTRKKEGRTPQKKAAQPFTKKTNTNSFHSKEKKLRNARGKKILGLEKGKYLPRPANWQRRTRALTTPT